MWLSKVAMGTCCRSNLREMETIGQKVRRIRESRFMSQEELAAAAKVSRATVQNVEADRRLGQRGKTVRSLAAALGVHVSDLAEPDAETVEEIRKSVGAIKGQVASDQKTVAVLATVAEVVRLAVEAIRLGDAVKAEGLLTDVLLAGGIDSVPGVAGKIAPPPQPGEPGYRRPAAHSKAKERRRPEDETRG